MMQACLPNLLVTLLPAFHPIHYSLTLQSRAFPPHTSFCSFSSLHLHQKVKFPASHFIISLHLHQKVKFPASHFITSTSSSAHSSLSITIEEDSEMTLLSFLSSETNLPDDGLLIVLTHIQAACKQIASLLASPSSVMAASSKPQKPIAGGTVDSGRDAPKPLDIISNDIIKLSLRSSGKVSVVASEEDDSPILFNETGPYVVVFDPLDGSRNIDASIPTGSIFGIYRRIEKADGLPAEQKAQLNVLQSGERLIGAAYALYSSATILCIAIGSGTHAFTLDRSVGEFILTHPNLVIPQRGQIYSVNDARYFDWPRGLQKYIDDIRQGKGQNPKKYSARYICSLMADFHRTILYGGVAMNPRAHLRLVYEANPLSFIAEQAGGKGSDGNRHIMSIQPVKLHQRLPFFVGSTQDVSELESYGDVQQLVNPGYEV